jgi:signal recognition particle GTPase
MGTPAAASACRRIGRIGRAFRVSVRAAMFDNLSRSMEKAWKLVSKDSKLSAENIKEPLKEIRRALLEADVSLPVVRRFVKKVEERAVGQQVSRMGTRRARERIVGPPGSPGQEAAHRNASM